jgi:tetratricopeptide (TPR) repeat protein
MKHRTISIIVLSFAAFLAANGQSAKTSLNSIESLIRSQHYEQAIGLIKSSLHEKPDDFRLWSLEGIAMSLQGNTAGALTAFDHALHLAPGYLPALRGKVQLLYQSQDLQAIPLLDEIVKVDSHDATAHEMLGVLNRKQGNCKTAIEHFEQSAGLIQTHPASLAAYGDCLLNSGQPKEAVPVFERLASLLPQSVDSQYDLALALVASKEYQAALKVIEPMLAANPSDSDLLSLSAEAYEASGDTPRAVAALRQAIVLSPTNPSYYVAFASLCLAHSSFQVGIDMINAGLQRIHNDSSLYLSRGLLYAQLAKYDQAEDDFHTAEQLDSSQSLSSYAIDLAEIERNQGDKALQNIRTQLKAHPDSPWLHYALARLLDNKGSGADAKSFEEAKQSALEAVRLKPDLIEARNLLTNMYLHSEQYDAAIEQSRQVLQLDPENESALYHLILALRRSGTASQSDEIEKLAKQLSGLQQASFHKEIETNRYKLVEQAPPSQ